YLPLSYQAPTNGNRREPVHGLTSRRESAAMPDPFGVPRLRAMAGNPGELGREWGQEGGNGDVAIAVRDDLQDDRSTLQADDRVVLVIENDASFARILLGQAH